MSPLSQTSGAGQSQHSTQTAHSALSSASPEAQQQPPFPQPQVNPEARSPKPQHPNTEALLNAAAQHVFPESERTKMPPSKESGDTAADEKAQVTEEGRHHPREDHEDREEEPIIGGTPLDEMTPMESPGAGSGGFPFNKSRARPREGQSNLMESTIPENEATIKEASGKEKEFSVKAVRPGMGPSKEVGSVCPSLYRFCVAHLRCIHAKQVRELLHCISRSCAGAGGLRRVFLYSRSTWLTVIRSEWVHQRSCQP